ncbi:MAG: hypothetical protein ACM3KH_00240 [Thiobacillus sp.]
MTKAESETPFTDKIEAWGESGSFFPSLIPDAHSQIALRSIQRQIHNQFPESKPVKHLHSTIFYSRPRLVYDYLKDKVNPDVKKPYLYSDLTSNFFAIWTSAPNFFELPVESLEKFGRDNDIIAVKLGRTAAYRVWSNMARDLFSRTLRSHGVLDDDLEAMRSMPEFEWSLGESTPHVSLLTDAENGDLPSIKLPDTIRFDSLSDGKVDIGGEDPLRFYLGL